MTILRVCRLIEVPEGEAKRFVVRNFDVAVYNLGGRVYATDDTCTHGPSSLSDGYIEGDTIECPFHYGSFHIPTGKPIKFPCTIPLQVYQTQIIDGDIFIVVN